MIFNKKYFFIFLLLLAVEIFIALFIHQGFIRANVGDILVVILLYALVRSFIKTTALKAAAGVFIFAVCVEMLQYFNIVNLLHLDHNYIAGIVIGHYFSWIDIGCYFVGIVIVLVAEKVIARK